MPLRHSFAFTLMTLILVGIVAAFLGSAGPVVPYVPEDAYQEQLVIAGTPIKVEIMDTPETRTKGLSGRAALRPFHGVLFVFETDDDWGIWMKEMQFPIDVAWLDASRTVVHLEENIQPASYPRIYRPHEPARYVLELPAGFVEAFNVRVGDTASW